MGLGSLFGGGSSRTVARTVPIVKDATGSPAVSLDKVESTGGVDLRKKTEVVSLNLTKKGMGGVRAQVMVILDHSGSMHSDYANGKVQDLVERFLGFALAVDIDGEVPIIAFDSRVHDAVNVNMTNYKDVVATQIWKRSSMGTTDLTAALKVVRDEASKTDAPLFVAIVTDGSPDHRATAKELVIDLARYPVFLKFLAVRDVPFLRDLDDLGDDKRLLDNVDTKEYSNLDNVSDDQFAADMVDEWDSWVTEATSKGILTN